MFSLQYDARKKIRIHSTDFIICDMFKLRLTVISFVRCAKMFKLLQYFHMELLRMDRNNLFLSVTPIFEFILARFQIFQRSSGADIGHYP